MFRLFTFATALTLVVASLSSAASIVVGEHGLLPETPGQVIVINVSGSDAIAGMDFFAKVGDGGPELVDFAMPAGTNAPGMENPETDVDVESGIFLGNNTGQFDMLSPLGSIPQLVAFGIITSEGTVDAHGVLAELTIDTTGFVEGSWPLAISSTLAGNTSLNNNLGQPIEELLIQDGTIFIQRALPEPGSFVLGLIGALLATGSFLIRRRARK